MKKKSSTSKKKGKTTMRNINMSFPSASNTLKRRNSGSHSFINDNDDDNLFIYRNSNYNPNKTRIKTKTQNTSNDEQNINIDSNIILPEQSTIAVQENIDDALTIEPNDLNSIYSFPLDIQNNNSSESNTALIDNFVPNTCNNHNDINIIDGNNTKDDDLDCLLISPWQIFVEIYKPIFTSMFPNESKMEIYRHLQNKWKQFDEGDKKVYIEKANYKNRAVVRLNHIKLKKKMKKEKDRKTVSPYSLYVEERHQMLKNERPELSLIERSAVIADEWKKLSSVDKRRYMNMAKRQTRIMQKQSPDDSDFEEDEY